MTAICNSFSIIVVHRTSFSMSILYKRYFGHLRIVKSSDVMENPKPRASRRSWCVGQANIRACKRICKICLLWPEVEMCFFVVRPLTFPGATFPSLWFRVLVDLCSCSGVWLIGSDGWLYRCVMALCCIDSVVMSVGVVKSCCLDLQWRS